MKIIQAEFKKVKDQTHKVVWVDKVWNLRPGDIVSFKDEEELWVVNRVYDSILDSEDINLKWGLDLPKSVRTER